MYSRATLSAMMLSLLILGSGLGVLLIFDDRSPYGPLSGPSDGDETNAPDPGLSVSSHLLTASEMEELKAHVGVYEGTSPDEVLTTGLRPPTDSEWRPWSVK